MCRTGERADDLGLEGCAVGGSSSICDSNLCFSLHLCRVDSPPVLLQLSRGEFALARLRLGSNGLDHTRGDEKTFIGIIKIGNPAANNVKDGLVRVDTDLSQFAATTSLQLKGVLSDESGSGALVFATSPTLVTPVLGTPSSGDISACTSTSMVLTTPVLGTVTSGDISACTSTSLTMVTPVLGTVTSGDVSACTSTSQTFVTPALGTPSALVLTNATGTLTSPTFVTPALGTVASGDVFQQLVQVLVMMVG